MPKKKVATSAAVIKPPTPPPPVPADRVEQTVKWILAGEREFDVVANAVQTWPDQDISGLMGAVADHFRGLAKINDPDVVRGWAFAATQEVFRRALITDPAVALRAIKQLMEISGA